MRKIPYKLRRDVCKYMGWPGDLKLSSFGCQVCVLPDCHEQTRTDFDQLCLAHRKAYNEVANMLDIYKAKGKPPPGKKNIKNATIVYKGRLTVWARYKPKAALELAYWRRDKLGLSLLIPYCKVRGIDTEAIIAKVQRKVIDLQDATYFKSNVRHELDVRNYEIPSVIEERIRAYQSTGRDDSNGVARSPGDDCVPAGRGGRAVRVGREGQDAVDAEGPDAEPLGDFCI